MSQQNIKQLKVKDLLDEELRLQKAQQAIDELYIAANSDETLKGQLEAATSRESLVEIATKHGYELAVADLERLRHRVQEQAQLNSNEFDDDELSEQELELVAGGKPNVDKLSEQELELVAGVKPGGTGLHRGWDKPKWPPC